MITFDIDDLTDERILIIEKLSQRFPFLRGTLFAIPAQYHGPHKLCGFEVAQHGWTHDKYECMKWDYKKAAQAMAGWGWCKGFKAPHWAINQAVLDACRTLGRWIAVHPDQQNIDCIHYKHQFGLSNFPVKDDIRIHTHFDASEDSLENERLVERIGLLSGFKFQTISEYLGVK